VPAVHQRHGRADIGIQVRYPDLGVDCGEFIDEDMEASAPRVVFEVLSQSTRAFDLVRKVEEYKSVSSLRHIILVDTGEPKIIHWQRPDGGPWAFQTIEGFESTLEIADLDIILPLRTLYNSLRFPNKPRLVMSDEPEQEED